MPGIFSPAIMAMTPGRVFSVPQCGACGLWKHCKSPKMPVTGQGKRGILICAEAPGKNEDDQGKQLVGESGQIVEASLRKCGIDLRRDCWLTNAVICRPTTAGGSNRTPTDKELSYCQPNIIKTIKQLNPQTIILLGGPAIKSVIEPLWSDKNGFAVERWTGWTIPSQQLNAWICPTYHPAFLIYEKKKSAIPQLFFDRHIQAAVTKTERPWQAVPDYKSKIDIIFSDKEAAERIMLFTECSEGPLSFDYETNMIKPDHRLAQILCCTISSSKRAIAYPWHGRAIPATQKFLQSNVPKIAANLKFEERWTHRMFGHGVNNWVFDTMIAAHLLDCRRGVTGLKFQALVELGCPEYNHAVKPYMEGYGSNVPNRLKDVPMRDLLLYCGMDGLLEHKLAVIQMKKLGIEI